jgi:transposase InsO family protein
VVDYVRYWSERTGISYRRIVQWIGIPRSKFYQWQQRYGRVNEHNAWIPRDFWLRDWEKQAILEFWNTHSREGYRRMTYMMLDADIVAVSPSTVYRLLQNAGVLHRWNRNHTSSKGQGFQQPVKPHEHWHIDVSYINIQGTFYYLCSVLDGFSRYLVAWDIRPSMTECDVEIVLQRARERFPEARPRIISDNGPQFIARDFKQFIALSGMTHVRTSPYYPQSNGKMERWHQSAKVECLRPQTPQSLEDALRIVTRYVEHYNTVRLHSAIGYITPLDKLEGRAEQIFAARDARLEAARQARRTVVAQAQYVEQTHPEIEGTRQHATAPTSRRS